MKALLLKDLKAVGLFGLAGVAVDMLFVTVFADLNLAFLIVQVILTFLLTIVQPALEDRFGLAPFLNSLPVTRSEVVRAQYAGTGILALAGLGVLLAVPALLGALSPSSGVGAAVWLSPAGLLSFVVPVVLLELLFLPLYFRLGFGRAVWAFLISLLGLVVIGSGAAEVVSLLIGRPLSRVFPVDRGILAVPYKPFLPLAGRLKDALGTAGLGAAVLGVLALLGWLSIRLSIRFFRRREL